MTGWGEAAIPPATFEPTVKQRQSDRALRVTEALDLLRITPVGWEQRVVAQMRHDGATYADVDILVRTWFSRIYCGNVEEIGVVAHITEPLEFVAIAQVLSSRVFALPIRLRGSEAWWCSGWYTRSSVQVPAMLIARSKNIE